MNSVARQRFTEGVIIILLVVVMYIVAQKYNLYYIFKYIDWVQHFFGGIGIGVLTTAFFGRSIKFGMSIVTMVAVVWEIFERIGHLYLPLYINYGGVFDTAIDILCAILGTSLVLLMTRE